MTRRRTRHRPPTCRDCGARIRWFIDADHNGWRKFDPTPHAPGDTALPVYPVLNERTVWRTHRLVDELMATRGCSRTEAETEVADITHYTPHTCTPEHHEAVQAVALGWP